jgi:hypothetical protein
VQLLHRRPRRRDIRRDDAVRAKAGAFLHPDRPMDLTRTVPAF